MFFFDTVLGKSLVANSSATIIFGDLTKLDRAVDGIFGFGQHELSVISQLSSRGVAPKVFSPCLTGANSGGGILVFGGIMEPNIVYSPLVPNHVPNTGVAGAIAIFLYTGMGGSFWS